MKKLLVLMLVLGLTSVASARNTGMAIQLSIDGVPAPDEITLMESDWVMLDIMAADGYALDSMELDLEVVGPGHIELDPQNVTVPTDIIVAPFESWSLVVDGVTEKGIGAIVGMTFDPAGLGGQLVNYILFHCDGLGDVTITITDAGANNDPVNGDISQEMMGSIIIHQIPEPTTVMLLGLGSLFLLRRRK
jgi:hypothetical protein